MGYSYSSYGSYYGGWAPYVSMGERRLLAQKEVARLRKRGQPTAPVVISGRAIANTFWGKAWCDNLEAYSDYSNRLPRGRTYVRNGSVVDLQIAAGQVTALVMGSQLYRVQIDISPIAATRWKGLIKECSGKIDSLVELLQGKLSQGVMEILTRKGQGLFPGPQQLKLACSCPDSAILCKHVAAALYGVGARLDHEPELLFRLRQVDQVELCTVAGARHALGKVPAPARGKALADEDLSALFGIDLDPGERESAAKPARAPRKTPTKPPTKSVAPAAAVRRPKAKGRALVTRKELLARGIAPATVQTWLRLGLLVPSGERGAYKASEPARKLLAATLK